MLVDMTRTKSLGWITRLSLMKNLCWHIYNYTWIIPFEKSLEKVFISYFFKRFFKEGRLCKSPFKNYFFFTDNGRSHYHPWDVSKEWEGWGHVCKHLFPVTECFLQLYLWSGCFTNIMTYMSKIMYYYIIMIWNIHYICTIWLFKYYKFHFLMNFLESLNQCSFDVVVYFLYKSAVWWLSWSHVLDTACFPFTKYNTYMYTPSVSELIQSCIQTSVYPLINPKL